MESCGLGMIFLRLFDLTLFYIIYIIGRNKNETKETAPVSFSCGFRCSFLFGWLCVLFRQLRKIFYGCILFCLHDFIFSFLFLLTCFLLISVLILRLPQFFLIHQLHLFSFSNTCLTNAGLADILFIKNVKIFY